MEKEVGRQGLGKGGGGRVGVSMYVCVTGRPEDLWKDSLVFNARDGNDRH